MIPREALGASRVFHGDRPTEMRIGDSVVMVSGVDPREAMRAFLYDYVSDTDAAYQQALSAGATSVEEPRTRRTATGAR